MAENDKTNIKLELDAADIAIIDRFFSLNILFNFFPIITITKIKKGRVIEL